MLNETEMQEIEKRLKFAIKNGHAGSAGYILIERNMPALLSTVREQRELIEEQLRTIQALMMGVEEHTGKEGTTPVLRYICELQRQNDTLTDIVGQCRAAAGWGTDADPMNVQSWAAMGDPAEVPGFIRDQFRELQRQVRELRKEKTP